MTKRTSVPAAAEPLLTTAEAAELLSKPARTLESWRLRGLGPDFVRVGTTVRYRGADLERWLDAHTVRTGDDQ